MERWYIAFNTVGSPHETLAKLVQAVREHRLGEFVVRFCYEKGTGKKRGQFYVFIGVASEEKGVIPQEIYNEFYTMLQRLHLSDHQMYVYFDDVKRMVPGGKELEIHNLRQIKMLQLHKLEPSDPFSYAGTETTDTQAAEINPAYNDLLYWLSAYGRGTWQQFRAACQELGLDPKGEYARRIVRRLRSLGHLEFTNEGQNWFISPSCLVETSTGEEEYCVFLAGQRSPHLIQNLQQVAQVESEPHPYGNAPEVVRVVFTSQDDAEDFTKSFTQQHHLVHLVGRADLRIASALPDLVSWEASLPALSLVKGNYTYEQWINNGFYPIELPKETGLYQLTHISTRFEHPQLTLFYNAEKDRWHKSDWYGLRYLMLRRTGEICDFHYDEHLNTLSIAKDQRLPDLYERSLILASGRLPIHRHDQVIFGNISETLAHLVANKLEAEFIEYRGI
jgi:hypothetical protein